MSGELAGSESEVDPRVCGEALPAPGVCYFSGFFRFVNGSLMSCVSYPELFDSFDSFRCLVEYCPVPQFRARYASLRSFLLFHCRAGTSGVVSDSMFRACYSLLFEICDVVGVQFPAKRPGLRLPVGYHIFSSV